MDGFSLTALRDALLSGVLNWGGRILTAAAIVLCGVFVRKLLRLGVQRLTRLPGQRAQEAIRRHRALQTLLLHSVDAVVWFIIVVAALSALGVNVASILTVAGVGGIAIGLGAQSIVTDVLAGVLILLEEQYVVGDTVTLAGFTGAVERMSLRSTALRSFAGDLHVVPNGEIRNVTNHTRSFHRALVDLSVDYAEPLDRVQRVLEQTLAACFPGMEGLTAAPELLGVVDLADSGVVLRVCAECAPGEHWAVERQLRRLIKDAFDREGIVLSIPQRMVHLAPDARQTPDA